jgi:AraC family transcriptional regulator, melibiose operon regulatory protein
MHSKDEILLEQLGLTAWRGTVSSMAEPHRHNEIELNFVSHGEIAYLFGGRTVRLGPGQLMLFWGAFPHRLTERAPGTILTWLTLPLSVFIGFGLPEALMQPLLHGAPICEPEPDANDETHFARWLEDARDVDPERRRIFELELEARLRRLALRLEVQAVPVALQTPERDGSRAAQLAEFIAAHYLDPIRLEDIARAAGLNANYASGLFRETFSMTMLEFLTQHRLAHAQRLLTTTDACVLEVAFASGFGSSSRFQAAFGRACGMSPSTYRRQVRRREQEDTV